MKNAMKMDAFHENLENEYYKQDDLHNMYYAEIVAAYVIE
jgi:hypothetical protein